MAEFMLLYVIFGIGILGSCKHWDHRGWAFYSVFFPAHSLILSLAKDLWPYVRGFFVNPWVQRAFIGAVLWILYCLLAHF